MNRTELLNASKKRIARRLLRTEHLEPRQMLTINWTGEAGDGQWSNPANWSGNAVPTANDDVVIDETGIGVVELRGVGHAKSVVNYERLALRADNSIDTQLNTQSIYNFGTIELHVLRNDQQVTLNASEFVNEEGGMLRVANLPSGSQSINGVHRVQGSFTNIGETNVTGNANLNIADPLRNYTVNAGRHVGLFASYTIEVIGANEVRFLGSSANDTIVASLGNASRLRHNLPLQGRLVSPEDFDWRLPGEQPFLISSQTSLVMHGGDGDDVLDASRLNFDVTLDGGTGNDTLLGGSGNDRLSGQLGNDRLEGNDGNDRLFDYYLYDFYDYVVHYDIVGKDILIGGNGDDLLHGGGLDQLYGGAGNDSAGAAGVSQFTLTDSLINNSGTISVDHSVESWVSINGTDNDDIIDASAFTRGTLSIFGNAGNDLLRGGLRDDVIDGGPGDDTLLGGAGNDRLSGQLGNDRLEGNDGNDRLFDNFLYDFYDYVVHYDIAGKDILIGGNGDDLLHGGGLDQLYGGAGNDSASAAGVSQFALTDSLINNSGTISVDHSVESWVSINGTDNDDIIDASAFTRGTLSIFGNAGNDVLRGGSGDDKLMGGLGNDLIEGNAGNDTLFDERGEYYHTLYLYLDPIGKDVLNGGSGDDTLYGATHDQFVGGAGSDFASLAGVSQFELSDRSYKNDGILFVNHDIESWSISGTDQNDVLDASVFTLGSVSLSGGDGHDTLIGGLRADTLEGNAGNDLLRGGPGDDLLMGYNGDDILEGDDGDDRLFDGLLEHIHTRIDADGRDILRGGQGNDSFAGESDDILVGNSQSNFGGSPGYRVYVDATSGQDQIELTATGPVINGRFVQVDTAAFITIDALGGSDTVTIPDGIPYAYEIINTVDKSGSFIANALLTSTATETILLLEFNKPIYLPTLNVQDFNVRRVGGAVETVKSIEPADATHRRFHVRFNNTLLTPAQYSVRIGPNVADVAGFLMNEDRDSTNGEADDVYSALLWLTRPDLEASHISAASTRLIAGTSTNVTWQVTSRGDLPLIINWNDSLVLSKDQSVSGDDTFLGQVQARGSAPFQPGATYTSSMPIQVPLLNDLTSGDYFLIITTDSQGLVPETNELNNSRAIAVTFEQPPAPDLTVQSITMPTAGTAGGTINVTYQVQNLGDAPAGAPYVDSIYLSLDGSTSHFIHLANVPRVANAAAGSTYTATQSITLPALADGAYRLFVETDGTRRVFERGRESNNTQLSAPLTLQSPDLTASQINITGSLLSGQQATIAWKTSNQGSSGTLGGWTDRIYLSSDNTLTSEDTLLGSYTHTAALATSASVDVSSTITWPNGTSGDYFIFVVADAFEQVAEPERELNNSTQRTVALTLAPYADLVVTQFDAPAQVIGDPASARIFWTVRNDGTGSGPATRWVDTVVLTDLTGDQGSIQVAQFTRTGALGVGQSYARTETVALPPGISGRFQLSVHTDAQDDVYEHTFEANNRTSLATPLDIMPIPYADLVVNSFTALNAAATGKNLRLRWVAENVGIGPTSVGNWFDRIVLSEDPQGNKPLRGFPLDIDRFGDLAVDGKYERTIDIKLPDVLPSVIYAHLSLATIGDPVFPNPMPYEFIYLTNNAFGPLAIAPTNSLTPDLHVPLVIGAPTAVEGGLLDVSWKVANRGTVSAAGPWIDRVLLRPVGVANPEDILLGNFNNNTALEPGLSYDRTEQVRLPMKIQGLYEVVVMADADEAVFERAPADANNRGTASTRLNIGIQPRVDLQFDTSKITAPERVDGGGTITVGYEVINQGTVPTLSSPWTDRIYLSLDNRISRDDLILLDSENVSSLAPGERYKNSSRPFQIPLRYRNEMFLIFEIDAKEQIDEYPNDDNNIFVKPIFIVPQPVADLMVTRVIIPPQVASDTEIPLRFTIENRGSGPTDRSEWLDTVWLTRDRNRPHPGQGDILLKSLPHQGSLARFQSYDVETTITLPTGLEPGVWYITPWTDPYDVVTEDTLVDNENPDEPDQVDNNNYRATPIDVLSRLPDFQVTQVTAVASSRGGDKLRVQYRVENRGNADEDRRWFDHIYLSDNENPYAENAHSILLAEVPHTGQLNFGTGYARDVEIELSPSAVGRYLIVVADGKLHAREVSENNNARSRAIVVEPILSDLQVTKVIFEPDLISGETTTVRYTVTNKGPASVWTGTKYWRDFLWISSDPSFDRARSSYLDEVVYQNDRPLNPGDSIEIVHQVTLPVGIGGRQYLHIHLDAHNDFSPFIDPARSRMVRTEEWPWNTGNNSELLDHFARWAFDDPRNNLHSEPMQVEFRESNLKVSNVIIPENLRSGQTIPITYTVSNIGNRTTRASQWSDRIFISHDASLNGSDYEMGVASGGRALRPGESYTVTQNVTLPEGIDGNFFIMVYADSPALYDPALSPPPSDVGYDLPGIGFKGGPRLAPWDMNAMSSRSLSRGVIWEFTSETDNLLPTAVNIALTPPPDLQVTNVEAPARADIGSLVDVHYTVINRGSDTPNMQSQWSDLVYLSRDPVLDLNADYYLGVIEHRDGLAAGQQYRQSFQFQVPRFDSRAWYVIVVTDPIRRGQIGNVFEAGNERNNATASIIPIILDSPPPSDLVVTGVTAPANLRSGENVTVEWTVLNNSTELAKGSWFDSVYISDDATWSTSDVLVGRVQRTKPLQPGQTYTAKLTAGVPAVKPGTYRFIVRTDIFDNIIEGLGESNNATIATDVTRVTVPALQLGVEKSDTLEAGKAKLYELVVPTNAQQVTETVRVQVFFDDQQASSELYISREKAPTGSDFDAIAQTTSSADRLAIVPSAQPGIYYVLLRGRSVNPDKGKVRILADLMPLQVTDVSTDVAGDDKFVTLTITGAQFDSKFTQVSLNRPGIRAVLPKATQVVNSAKMRATFDLTGVPHGLYDLVVSNGSLGQIVVPYRVQVQQAIQPDVTLGIGGPRTILMGERGTYSLSIQSLSNIDTPYVFFQVGVPEMGLNSIFYNLPFLDFTHNIGGTPPNSNHDAVTWANLNSLVNTNGYKLASGYIMDTDADSFTGFTFVTQTYPGLKEMNDRKWNEVKEKISAFFPDLKQDLEDEGPKALDKIFKGLSLYWDAWGQLPGLWEKPWGPFQFNVTAAATALTRDEFIQHVSGEAEKLRQGILPTPPVRC